MGTPLNEVKVFPATTIAVSPPHELIPRMTHFSFIGYTAVVGPSTDTTVSAADATGPRSSPPAGRDVLLVDATFCWLTRRFGCPLHSPIVYILNMTFE